MLDGNEAFKKTLIDEQIEIRQKFTQDDLQNEAIESCKVLKTPARKRPEDRVFESEADLIAD